MLLNSTRSVALALAGALVGVVLSANAALADGMGDDHNKHALEEHEADYVWGVPAEPSDAWIIAFSGRLYDNWMSVLAVDGPGRTHPAWPASNTNKSGNTTWRCKSCHGWDFLGKDGRYGSGSYQTSIKGVRAVAGDDPEKIRQVIMDDTHKFTHDMIPERDLTWLAVFLSKGQYDIKRYVSDAGEVSGDPGRGKAIFQNVCAACHGYDGTTLDWSEDGAPSYVGTEANANPWEVFFKIRHGHPGVEMVSLAAFSHEDAASVLAYAKTLPQQ